MKLTIGMPSYDNFSEVWFTLQALRLYQDLEDTEIIVVDNYGCEKLKSSIESWMKDKVRYIKFTDIQSPAHAKNKVFEEALGEWVLCMDSHILLPHGTVGRFKWWISTNPDCMDLLQGPLMYDNLSNFADRFKDVWSGQMWGQWQGGIEHYRKPYEIQMQGCGLLACRRDAWLGFHKDFRGFGGEEGYIHEKFRQAGRKVLCLPWLKWVHKFQTVGGKVNAPYAPLLYDKIHNYKVGFEELGLDPAPIKEHFKLTDEQFDRM